jgi:LmbE family N-acetylglucosaminyl deacetylase
MHTGAHPDDEDSALVAYHARRQNARTAYLSLTRGSGGQNIIGTEQSDLLGVIRTEELLQARQLDGAQQLFTSANDFGFSKHRTEASRMWDEETVLGDMVRAIRQFRPTVIISRWNGTPADGHGHHQFAGYLTPIAVEAAADPGRYPEHFNDGLSPWRIDKFYVMQRFTPGAVETPSLVINTGEYSAVAGRSYFEIGMQGRSQQKTQQMGSLELRGDQFSGLQLVESHVDTSESESGIFDGIDTSISGIAAFESEVDPELTTLLSRLESMAADALLRYEPLAPGALIPALTDSLGIARAARAAASSQDAQRLIDEKIGELESALILAAGISVDALAESETAIAGESLQVATRIYGSDQPEVSVVDVNLRAPTGWSVNAGVINELSNESNYRRRDSGDAEFYFDVTVSADERPTQPYWLELPRERFTYDWSQAGDSRNQPFQEPLLIAEVTIEIGNEQFLIEKEVQHRYVDRIRGEIRRPIDVVPSVSVEPATDLQIIPASTDARRYELLLTVRNNERRAITGTAGFTVPTEWIVEPAFADFSLAANPASTTMSFEVTLPDGVRPGDYELLGGATVDGVTYDQAMNEIAYPHIQTHRSYDRASTSFKIIDVDVAPVNVGYPVGDASEWR